MGTGYFLYQPNFWPDATGNDIVVHPTGVSWKSLLSSRLFEFCIDVTAYVVQYEVSVISGITLLKVTVSKLNTWE